MHNARSLWQRLFNHSSVEGIAPSANGVDGASDLEASTAVTIKRPSASNEEKTPWWNRRSERTALVRENAQRAGDLMDAMESHFRTQDERGRQMIESVQNVARVLEQFTEQQRTQGDALRSIAQDVVTARQHTAIVSESISRVPQTLQAQGEALRALGTRLEASREGEERLTQSLQTFGTAVDALRGSSHAQVEMLARLSADEREQRDALTSLVKSQSRALMLISIVGSAVLLLTLAALAGWIWVTLR